MRKPEGKDILVSKLDDGKVLLSLYPFGRALVYDPSLVYENHDALKLACRILAEAGVDLGDLLADLAEGTSDLDLSPVGQEVFTKLSEAYRESKKT